jgi:hypothetical protein
VRIRRRNEFEWMLTIAAAVGRLGREHLNSGSRRQIRARTSRSVAHVRLSHLARLFRTSRIVRFRSPPVTVVSSLP